ncbi:MAG: hypothetical protein LCH69_10035 [Proteobacteria bacterium]|nr:hypothetical protein [Pseudomonadota bacterium]
MSTETFGNAKFQTCLERQARLLIDALIEQQRQRCTSEGALGLIALAVEINRAGRAILSQIERTER